MRLGSFGSLGLGLMVLVFTLGTAGAEEQTKEQVVSFGISADYFTKYIWRGQNIDGKSVFQPAVSVGAYGFTGSIWGNLDLTNQNDTAGEFSEFDFSLDYSGTVPGTDWLDFSVGTIYYRFPNTDFEPTTEIYGGLSLSKVFLTPYVKWFRDVDEINGSYLQFGIGHTVEKVMTWNESFYCDLALSTSFGWGNSAYNKGYFGVPSDRFNDVTISVGLPVTIGSWVVKPSFNHSSMLSGSIRKATAKSSNTWFGVGILTSF